MVNMPSNGEISRKTMNALELKKVISTKYLIILPLCVFQYNAFLVSNIALIK
jgi:hypothetical protein